MRARLRLHEGVVGRFYAEAIRAIADPMVEERQQKLCRLRQMAEVILAPKIQIEQQPFERCPGEEATKIMEEAGISRVDPVKPKTIDAHKLRGPKSITVEDYVQLGLTRADAEKAVAEMQAAADPEPARRSGPPAGSIGAHLPQISEGA